MNPILLLGASTGPELTAQIVVLLMGFAITLAILSKLAWGPVTSILDERRKLVSDQFEDIDQKMTKATALLKEYEEKLRHIDEEARERQNKAIDEGRRMATELIEKARQESEEITSKAQMQIELDKARIELRREVVEMTLAATGKLLAANLDDARQRELVDSFIADVEKERA